MQFQLLCPQLCSKRNVSICVALVSRRFFSDQTQNESEKTGSKKLKTGSKCLDWALGGGYPLGSFIQLSVTSASDYKYASSLGALALKEAQDINRVCYYASIADAQKEDTAFWLQKLGLDPESCIVMSTSTTEDTTRLMGKTIQQEEADSDAGVFLLDSLARVLINSSDREDLEKSNRKAEEAYDTSPDQDGPLARRSRKLADQFLRALVVKRGFSQETTVLLTTHDSDLTDKELGLRLVDKFSSVHVKLKSSQVDVEPDYGVHLITAKVTRREDKESIEVTLPFKVEDGMPIGIDEPFDSMLNAFLCGYLEESSNPFILNWNGTLEAQNRRMLISNLRENNARLQEFNEALELFMSRKVTDKTQG